MLTHPRKPMEKRLHHSIRFTRQEKKAIAKAALVSGVNFSEFVREAALAKCEGVEIPWDLRLSDLVRYRYRDTDILGLLQEDEDGDETA